MGDNDDDYMDDVDMMLKIPYVVMNKSFNESEGLDTYSDLNGSDNELDEV
jgi:hypothetical protein